MCAFSKTVFSLYHTETPTWYHRYAILWRFKWYDLSNIELLIKLLLVIKGSRQTFLLVTNFTFLIPVEYLHLQQETAFYWIYFSIILLFPRAHLLLSISYSFVQGNHQFLVLCFGKAKNQDFYFVFCIKSVMKWLFCLLWLLLLTYVFARF